MNSEDSNECSIQDGVLITYRTSVKVRLFSTRSMASGGVLRNLVPLLGVLGSLGKLGLDTRRLLKK